MSVGTWNKRIAVIDNVTRKYAFLVIVKYNIIENDKKEEKKERIQVGGGFVTVLTNQYCSDFEKIDRVYGIFGDGTHVLIPDTNLVIAVDDLMDGRFRCKYEPKLTAPEKYLGIMSAVTIGKNTFTDVPGARITKFNYSGYGTHDEEIQEVLELFNCPGIEPKKRNVKGKENEKEELKGEMKKLSVGAKIKHRLESDTISHLTFQSEASSIHNVSMRSLSSTPDERAEDAEEAIQSRSAVALSRASSVKDSLDNVIPNFMNMYNDEDSFLQLKECAITPKMYAKVKPEIDYESYPFQLDGAKEVQIVKNSEIKPNDVVVAVTLDNPTFPVNMRKLMSHPDVKPYVRIDEGNGRPVLAIVCDPSDAEA